MSQKSLEIAKIIGAPIDSNLKVGKILAEICDYDTAEPGEEVKTLVPDDANGVDTIYTADANGTITAVKVVMGAPTLLTFAHLQTKLEYVLVQEVLDSPDQSALGRRKGSIARRLDKIETKRVLDVLLGISTQEVVQATGDDIYAVIMKLMRKVENYSDNYVLLCGTDCWAKIDDYEKDNADNFNYRVSVNELLAEKKINKVKVIGNIKLDSGSDVPVLAADKMILVGRDSQLAQGKPVVMIRRKISAIAGLAGAEVDAEERALYVAETPTPFYNGTTLTHGYGIFGYESVIQAVLNFRAIAWAVVA
jgi:hypothetical protein